ncbi:hypothetical protein Q1695_008140 [Nippostrongylus brasiliensis]|nr:hypothetical protein Q1695_008140 [Nippostrongylus brasiliensis]
MFRTTTKRDDLQGIRGIAITAVVLFHFIPSVFPNGYVGVDQFFVLSGYLMSMMCEREKRFKTTEIVRFYFRRIKRIVPLYVMVMMGCVTISELRLFGHNDDTNWNAVRSAAAFATNIRSTNSVQGYLEMLHIGTDFYTHMWSISLEMQFYLIFPLLFFVYKHLWDELAQYYLAGIAMISLAYHVTLPSSRAFNLVHARIWQFVIGLYVHQMDNNEKSGGPLCIFWTPHFHRVLSVLSAVSCLWPYTVLPSLLLRIVATVLTAATILSYSPDNCTILTRKTLTYIGDISYALYLVHWPIYILVRQDFFDAFKLLLGIVIAVLVSVVLTETFEKSYLKAGDRTVIYMILCLYCALWSTILFNLVHGAIDGSNICVDPVNNTTLSIEDIIILNKKFTSHDTKCLTYSSCSYRGRPGRPWGWCDLPSQNSSSPYRILIIGNSYATNQGRAISESCNRPGIDMKQFSIAGCEVLTETESFEHCIYSKKNYMQAVQEYKPDSLFILTRHVTLTLLSTSTTKRQIDEYASKGTYALNRLAQAVADKVFVLNAIPIPEPGFEARYANGLRSGELPDPADLFNKSSSFGVAREIVERAVAKCPKCSMLDYVPTFTVNGTFRFFNPNTHILNLNGYWHFTSHGLNQLKPLFKEICRNITRRN